MSLMSITVYLNDCQISHEEKQQLSINMNVDKNKMPTAENQDICCN